MKMGRNDHSTPSIRTELGRVLDPAEQNRLVSETRRAGRQAAAAATTRGERQRRRREATAARPIHDGEDGVLHPASYASCLLLSAMFARGSPKLSARLLAMANGTQKKCSPKCNAPAKKCSPKCNSHN